MSKPIRDVELGKCDKCGRIAPVPVLHYPATQDEPAYTDYRDVKCQCGGTISPENMGELTPEQAYALHIERLEHELDLIEDYLEQHADEPDKVKNALCRKQIIEQELAAVSFERFEQSGRL